MALEQKYVGVITRDNKFDRQYPIIPSNNKFVILQVEDDYFAYKQEYLYFVGDELVFSSKILDEVIMYLLTMS